MSWSESRRFPPGRTGSRDQPVRILKITIEKKKVQPYLTATPDEMRKTVTLKTTLGNIKIKMEPDWAPENVRNFLMLASTGWYNGTVFHRIVKGFVVQGGTIAGQRAHPADRWVHPSKASSVATSNTSAASSRWRTATIPIPRRHHSF